MQNAKAWEPRANLPEFTYKANIKESKRKSIFIADDGNQPLEAILEIAKDTAQKMGMGDKALLQVKDASYSTKERGWQVIVQSRI
jgi:hypothetical protein